MIMDEHIRESNLIEGIDSREQDQQAKAAWAWLERQREINGTVVKKLHNILVRIQPDLKEEYKGAYRPIQVRIGTHVPPKPEDVKKEMSRWLKTFMQVEPKEAHVRFETIHPFVDGNGRVGRMLMWWHEKKIGRDPTLIKATDRWKYYGWFKGRGQPYEQGDLLGMLEAMRDES